MPILTLRQVSGKESQLTSCFAFLLWEYLDILIPSFILSNNIWKKPNKHGNTSNILFFGITVLILEKFCGQLWSTHYCEEIIIISCVLQGEKRHKHNFSFFNMCYICIVPISPLTIGGLRKKIADYCQSSVRKIASFTGLHFHDLCWHFTLKSL